MKCKKCGRTYQAKMSKGGFPRGYFEHRKKYHPNAGKKKGGKRGKSKRSRGGKSFEHSTGGYSKLTITLHN